jgi:Trk K+ transport system NAD-binding subunit
METFLKNAVDWFPGEMDVVSFYLNHDEDQEISMSFHLTELDKKKIISAFNSKDNQRSLEKLLELMEK